MSSSLTTPAAIGERSDRFDMAIAGSSTVLGVDVTIEPLTEMREVNLAWYVGLDTDATKIGDQMWNGEEIDEAATARVVGLFQLTFRDPSIVIRQGERRAGLSDPGDDAGQINSPEAAESGDRLTDPSFGGRRLSIHPATCNHYRRRHRRAQQRYNAVGRVLIGARSVCSSGEPETKPWTKLNDDGDRATFYAGSANIELLPHRDDVL